MATHFKQPSKYRSPRISFAPIREVFTKPVRAPGPDDQQTERWVAFARDAEPDPIEEILPRFPIVRQGYDCPAVDQYLTDLERELADADRELAQVRGQAPAADAVNEELRRIGEQTSAVLIAAHEQREEILRSARAEADQYVAEAGAEANTLTAKAKAELSAFEARTAELRRERDSLFEEIRQFSTALTALIENPSEPVAAQEEGAGDS